MREIEAPTQLVLEVRARPFGRARVTFELSAPTPDITEVVFGEEPIGAARLMAALSTATVVVEAGARSGSMKVAERAQELGRIVGAVPGPVTSATSVGPHQLISDGVARVVTHADEIELLHQSDRTRPRNDYLQHSSTPRVPSDPVGYDARRGM